MQLPKYSLAILFLIQAGCIIAIALVIKRLYRSAVSQLFAAEPVAIADAPDEPDVHPFAITVRPIGDESRGFDWRFAGAFHGLLRWLVYAASGVAVLYLVDWLFLPTPGRSARWENYMTVIGLIFVVMLAVGQLRIRVASSGLWVFAYIVGFASGITLFGVVFVSIPTIIEYVRQGFLSALLVIPGAALLLGMISLGLWLIYQMARGFLWIHRFLAEHGRASTLYVGMVFFWAWACYFSLSSQLPMGEGQFEKLAKFLLVPLLLYAVISSVLLWIVKTLAPKHRPRGLLFLRSFTRARESERLFRRLVHEWTEVGPLYVLSGPDIVKTTLDSRMLTAFLLDDLRSEFISSLEDVESRLNAIRKQRGWDLLYRVEEFKCMGAIWTSAFQKLLGYCDVVLVDLRGFDEGNTGTAFELFTLLQSGQAHKTLLLCNNETNLQAVEHIGRAALAQKDAASNDSTEGVTLIEVSGRAGRVRCLTMRLLLSMTR